MANNTFSNDINNAPDCTICIEKVVDNAGRSITKLLCGHFFHLDCIGSEFNARGIMICPNCRVIEEEGNWRLFPDFEDKNEDVNEPLNIEEISDEDEYYEEQVTNSLSPEDQMMDLLARIDVYNGGDTNMRQEDENNPWTIGLINNRQSTPPNTHHNPLQIMNNRHTTFSHAFVDESFIIQENGWIQPLRLESPIPPPPIAPEMIDQRYPLHSFEITSPNIGLCYVNGEASTSYGQACNNPLMSLETTLTMCTSLAGELRLLSGPCECFRCRPF